MPPSRTKSKKQTPPAPPAPPFVLVVDDSDDNRELYAEYFEYAGFRVAQAEDGDVALAMVAQDLPDVVIMDLAMPKLDGWEATRRIKADPKTSKVIVVVVTGNAVIESVIRAKDVGADEVFTKPCLPLEIEQSAKRLLLARSL
jgi:two-component system, cell cycle response regulator DivK